VRRIRGSLAWFVHPDRNQSTFMILLTRVSTVLGVVLPTAALIAWAADSFDAGPRQSTATTNMSASSTSTTMAVPAQLKPPVELEDSPALSLMFPDATVVDEDGVKVAVTDGSIISQPAQFPNALSNQDRFFQLINLFSHTQDGATRPTGTGRRHTG
jgi:hypothetical protein